MVFEQQWHHRQKERKQLTFEMKILCEQKKENNIEETDYITSIFTLIKSQK